MADRQCWCDFKTVRNRTRGIWANRIWSKKLSRYSDGFFGRISQDRQRRKFRSCKNTDGEPTAGLGTHIFCCRTGPDVPLPALTNFIRIPCNSGVRFRRQSLGLDAATPDRAPILGRRSTDCYPPRWSARQPGLGNTLRSVLPYCTSWRILGPACLRIPNRLVAARPLKDLELRSRGLLRKTDVEVGSHHRFMGRNGGLANSDFAEAHFFRRTVSRSRDRRPRRWHRHFHPLWR